jgi:hypothetical protein
MVITMVMANSNSGGKSKKAPIKVKQDMIDFIKTQGMTKALKRAGSISAKGTKGEAEFLEGVRRMYGANRLSAATKAATPKKGSYQAGAGMAKKGTYTTGSGVSKPAAKPTKTVVKPASKGMSSTTKRNLIGGAVLAGGLLAAKATPAGRAASAAVGLGKGIAGAMGRKTATKALSTSGKMAAKAKRPVSQAQYDAMKKVASAPKKFTKTKAAATGAGAVSMVPKPKKK